MIAIYLYVVAFGSSLGFPVGSLVFRMVSSDRFVVVGMVIVVVVARWNYSWVIWIAFNITSSTRRGLVHQNDVVARFLES